MEKKENKLAWSLHIASLSTVTDAWKYLGYGNGYSNSTIYPPESKILVKAESALAKIKFDSTARR